ncbi:Uncharacterized protein GBIM_02867 [Gryllus bimaculatus]|nr:Uncharacterized protein GBIM_02867 [Gryllus bimaculatus]
MGQFFSSNILNAGCSNSEVISEKNTMDIVGKLPPEIASIILRKLDKASLVNASLVNKRWFSLCQADHVLQKRICIQLYHTSKCLSCNSQKIRNSSTCILKGRNVLVAPVRNRAWFTVSHSTPFENRNQKH